MNMATLPRRNVIAGLAGLPAAPIPTTAMVPGGAMAALWARRQALVNTVATVRESDPAHAAAVTEWAFMDVTMPATPAIGHADALAALAWARAEFLEFHVSSDGPDRGERVMLDLLDKVAEALGGLA